jgi:hypothetical protein
VGALFNNTTIAWQHSSSARAAFAQSWEEYSYPEYSFSIAISALSAGEIAFDCT